MVQTNMTATDSDSTLLALDVGARRIGVAVARIDTQIASPLQTLNHDETIFAQLQKLVAEQAAVALVLGLPRGLDGQETGQTRETRAFASELRKHLDLPFYWQDEAVTSRQAEAELQSRGKPYVRGDIDALAATYILEDYLREHGHEIEIQTAAGNTNAARHAVANENGHAEAKGRATHSATPSDLEKKRTEPNHPTGEAQS